MPRVRHRAFILGLILVWMSLGQYDMYRQAESSLSISAPRLAEALLLILPVVFGFVSDYVGVFALWTIIPALHAVALLTLAVTTNSASTSVAGFILEYNYLFTEICLARFLVTAYRPAEYFLVQGLSGMFSALGSAQRSTLSSRGLFEGRTLSAGLGITRLAWVGAFRVWLPEVRPRLEPPGIGSAWGRLMKSPVLWCCIVAFAFVGYFASVSSHLYFARHEPFDANFPLASYARFVADAIAIYPCWWLRDACQRMTLGRAVTRVMILGLGIGLVGMFGLTFSGALGPLFNVIALSGLGFFYPVQTSLLLIAAGRERAGWAVGFAHTMSNLVFRWLPRVDFLDPSNRKEVALGGVLILAATALLVLAAYSIRSSTYDSNQEPA